MAALWAARSWRVSGVGLAQRSLSSPLLLPHAFACVAPSMPFVQVRSKSTGIVGLPNVGKSTLFNALTSSQLAQAANYPFCTIEPNTANVPIKDPLLDRLAANAGSKKTIYSLITFTDIAGLVKGAHKGEGLGNKFLSNIRDVSVIAHVVRCFDDPQIIHVDSTVDPVRDIQIVETELALADLQSVRKRQESMAKKLKTGGDGSAKLLMATLEQCSRVLNEGQMLSDVIARFQASSNAVDGWDSKMVGLLPTLQLLTTKPCIYVCNVSETDAVTGNRHTQSVQKLCETHHRRSVTISAQLESDASQLGDTESQVDYLKCAGVESTGLEQFLRVAFDMLGLRVFYTVGPEEARSWTIEKGTTAVDAAAEIHTDISRGFICAEIIKPQDLLSYGSEEAVKDAGKMTQEGKTYVMQTHDVVHFRFNV